MGQLAIYVPGYGSELIVYGWLQGPAGMSLEELDW